MTDYVVHVARIRDPDFDWRAAGDAGWQANLEPLFELERGLLEVVAVGRRAMDPASGGRQLDWGAWMVPVTKEELAARVARLDPAFAPARDVEARVAALAGDGRYALVAVEGI
jgi:hypothetical protein